MKIISGGQTGVDRAALDVAIDFGIPCGGWCPKGRRSEDGTIPDKYPMQETPSPHYEERTEWNVRDSDGTLILTIGKPTGGTALTIEFATKHDRPCLVVDLNEPVNPASVAKWIIQEKISILNDAGPRGSSNPQIYGLAVDLLKQALRCFAA